MNFTHQMEDERVSQKKNIGKKLLSSLLVFSFVLMFSVPALAATPSVNSTKQEVVYINLDSDGSVSKICVVNIFELDEDGQIVDYGDYTSLRNMTSNDKITFENETVRIDTKAGKLYYEGTLHKNVIPWIFSFHYFLDGTEYKAEELTGKDGALKITISIRKNPDCSSTFFDNYGLQASVTLDTELCKNIAADGATAANVGKNRQLTYTILPGTEKDITITADVTDFEMAAIAINGLPLNMEIDIDEVNTAELTEEINKLKDAVKELDDGAADLRDGAEEIRDGASDLKDGASDLKNGAEELTDGAGELKSGAEDLYKGASDLNSGAKDLLDGAVNLMGGASGLKDGVNDLHNGIKDASNGTTALADSLSVLSENSADLRNGAYTVFIQLTSTAETQLNQSLAAAGLETVALTPETYSEVITALLDSISDGAYSWAEAYAAEKIRTQVKTVVAEQIRETITNNSDIMAQIDAGVETACGAEIDAMAQNYAALELANAYAPDAPEEWLQTSEGQAAVDSYLATAEGQAALAEARAQIKAQYVDAAVAEQVTAQMEAEEVEVQMEAAIAEQLATDEVQQQISASVESALGENEAYQGIVALKGQLDSYYAFYLGLQQYTTGVDSAASGAAELKNGLTALESGSAELVSGTITLNNGVAELHSGVMSLKNGTSELLAGVIQLKNGAISLYDGTVEIRDGMADLLDGVITMYDGTIELYDGIVTLKDGTFEFKTETENLDTELKDKVGDAIGDILGSDFEVVSFVSEKNKNVESVQFVIQTEAIAIPEAPAPAAPAEEKLSFWQKLLRLFGLY
jgi:hypothetical protein